MPINIKPSGSSVIQPTKPYTATLNQASPAQDTYYTIVNITNGKGTINRIGANHYTDSNGNFTVKLTIDGTEYTLNNGNSVSYIRGMATKSGSTTTGMTANVYYDWFGTIFFTVSAKVEIKTATNDTGNNFTAMVDYALV